MTGPMRAIIPIAVLLLVALLGRAASAGHSATAATSPAEVWRLGVTSEGTAAQSATHGQPASMAASFRSNRGVADIYYIFPAAGTTGTIQSAAFHILRRSGAYTGTASLALEARAFDGSLLRTISAAPVDLQAAPTDAWADLALASAPAALAIAPGEQLAFHFSLDGASTGDLDVRPIFEVLLAPETTATATPTATATATPSPTATSTATPTATATPGQRKLYLPDVSR